MAEKGKLLVIESDNHTLPASDKWVVKNVRDVALRGRVIWSWGEHWEGFMALINCPECNKEISDKATACPYCGCPAGHVSVLPSSSSHEIETDSNIPTLLGLARTADIGGNTAEAEKYYTKVLEIDPTITEAWFGKGKAAGWLSALGNMRIAETIVAFKHAIATTSDIEKEATVSCCIEEVNKLITALYGMARKNLLEFVALPNTHSAYVQQTSQMILWLNEISNWDTSNKTILENIVHLCKDLIEGVAFNDQFDNNTSKVWHLSSEYEQTIRAHLSDASEKLKRLDPSHIAPNPTAKKPSESCFVVTATMGNPCHPTVVFMRKFRDKWLMHRKAGELFVRVYYRAGPMLARLISCNSCLRYLSYCLVVIPAHWAAKRILDGRQRENQ